MAFLAAVWSAAWKYPRAALALALAVILLLGSLVLSARLVFHYRAEAAVQRARAESADERAELKAAGVLVALRADRAALRVKLDTMKRESAAFAVAHDETLAQLRAAGVELKKLRTVLAASGTTGPLPAKALLREGDTAEIKVDLAIDQTDKRNLVLTIATEAVRLEPAPVETILAGKIKEAKIAIDPVIVEGPTVTKTRWWPVAVAAGSALVVGFCAADSHHCGLAR